MDGLNGKGGTSTQSTESSSSRSQPEVASIIDWLRQAPKATANRNRKIVKIKRIIATFFRIITKNFRIIIISVLMYID